MPRVPTHTDISCLWCGQALAGEAVGARRLRCERCGVENTHPRPDARELDAAYATWYRPQGGRFSGPGDALLAQTRSRLAGRIDEIAPPGPILDVGSGDGDLVEALRSRGRSAFGIERADEVDPGVEANAGNWAGMVFWHTLEHLPDPGARVDALPSELQADGVVLIAVPNRGSLQARAFGDRWFHLDIPRHLTHLTAGALVGRLRALGLKVERVSHLRAGQIVFGWLQGLLGSLPGHPDLYDAIRRPAARNRTLSPIRRLALLATAAALVPLALLLSAVEALAGRGGTVYVEARHV